MHTLCVYIHRVSGRYSNTAMHVQNTIIPRFSLYYNNYEVNKYSCGWVKNLVLFLVFHFAELYSVEMVVLASPSFYHHNSLLLCMSTTTANRTSAIIGTIHCDHQNHDTCTWASVLIMMADRTLSQSKI